MFPALIITIVVLVIVCVIVFIFVENILHNEREQNHFLTFEKNVYINLASSLDETQTFESAVNVMVSTLAQFFNFSSCAYVVKNTKELKFKIYLNTQASQGYVKVVERKTIEYFAKKSKLTNISSMQLEESISGFGISSEVDIHPHSGLYIPIYFKKNLIGIFTISSTDKNFKIKTNFIKLKKTISTVLDFVFELQEIGKSGTAKEEYMNMIIHDLRTPLTIIQGSCDMLIKRKKELPENIKDELITDTKGAAKRLLNIVDNLLDIAKLENGKFRVELKKVNIPDFLASVLNQYKLFVEERGLSFTVNVPNNDAFYCMVDTRIIERVMDNLISNAVKYTKTGGVTVTLEKIDSKNKVKISVADTGVGINKDKQNLLFNKFEQIVNPVDATSKSTGLGLVVAKKLIEENKGEMNFISTENVGSTFYFTLPLIK